MQRSLLQHPLSRSVAPWGGLTRSRTRQRQTAFKPDILHELSSGQLSHERFPDASIRVRLSSKGSRRDHPIGGANVSRCNSRVMYGLGASLENIPPPTADPRCFIESHSISFRPEEKRGVKGWRK